jgi:hypothetical protein
MLAFRAFLCLMFASLFVYTEVVGSTQGWNFISVFFENMFALRWPGQFNYDFTCFLLISGLWLAWRNHFSPAGIARGVLGSVGGMLFLAPYLLFANIQAKGDIKILLLGKVRAAV